MSEAPKGRKLELSIEIDATPEQVWAAITEAEQIVRWFAPEAKVEPGVGGSIWMSWGPGMEGASPIEIWEPNHHLRTARERGKAEKVKISVDYYLEPTESGTVLRLVHSGFGESADWDAEFDATRKAWPLFFEALKFGLEQHPKEPGRQVTITTLSPFSVDETWERLTGPQGLNAPRFEAGSAYRLVTAQGEEMQGTVRKLTEPTTLGLSVGNWNNALVAIFNEPCQGGIYVTFMVILYGEALNHSEERRAKIKQLLDSAFAKSGEAVA